MAKIYNISAPFGNLQDIFDSVEPGDKIQLSAGDFRINCQNNQLQRFSMIILLI